jgi:hypothetical protein
VPSLDRVYICELPPRTTLIVQTGNSAYRIMVMNGTEIRLQGGAYFPEPTSAHLDGASAGAEDAVMAGWIVVGLPMRITAGARRVLTSPIREIATARSVCPVIA